MTRGIGGEEREVLAEREQPPFLLEIALDAAGDMVELVEDAPLTHHFTSTTRLRSRFSIRQFSSVQTENESCPATVC